jgi:hypothetical protein
LCGVTIWRERSLWATVAAELRAYRLDGLGHLLTEDTLRFATVKALTGGGVEPGPMQVEWPHPAIKHSRIDLVVLRSSTDQTPEAFLEFKYPREPHEKNAAWTMALGDVLKDLYRLASCPGQVDRIFVYAETNRLNRYMTRSGDRYGLHLDADRISLHPEKARLLPTTAAQIIGAELAEQHVTATRLARLDVDGELAIAVYQVDPLTDPPIQTTAQVLEGQQPETKPAEMREAIDRSSSAGTRNGARREILDAVTRLRDRLGRPTFSANDVVAEMHRHGTGYAESTIRTMVTSHMCISAPDNAGTTYDDLERVDYGIYQLRRQPPR